MPAKARLNSDGSSDSVSEPKHLRAALVEAMISVGKHAPMPRA